MTEVAWSGTPTHMAQLLGISSITWHPWSDFFIVCMLSFPCLAVSGQCANEYITAGVAKSRMYFNDDEYPITSPAWGCDIPASTSYDASFCVGSRIDYGYSKAFDGDTNGLNLTDGVQSEPAGAYVGWRFTFAYFQVELDRAYSDGEGGEMREDKLCQHITHALFMCMTHAVQAHDTWTMTRHTVFCACDRAFCGEV